MRLLLLLLTVCIAVVSSLSLPFFHKRVATLQTHKMAMASNKSTAAAAGAGSTERAPVLAVGDVNFSCEDNLFCANTNPQGSIHFGTAMNRLVMREILQYLPSFLTVRDTVYQRPFGSAAFRALLVDRFVRNNNGESPAEELQFTAEQTVVVNNVHALLSILALRWKEVSLSGAAVDALRAVATHSDSLWRSAALQTTLSLSSQSARAAHVVLVDGALSETTTSTTQSERVTLRDAVEHYRWLQRGEHTHTGESNAAGAAPLTVFVLRSADDLAAFRSAAVSSSLRKDPSPSPRIVFAFSAPLSETTSCGVALTHDSEALSVLRADAFFSPLSSAVQAATLCDARLPFNDDKNENAAFNALAEAIKTSISLSEGLDLSRLPAEDVLFGTGGSSILDALGRVLFQPGDRLALDAPFYSGFVGDFARSGVTLAPIPFVASDEYPANRVSDDVAERALRRRVPNTLLLRAKRAWEDGCRGYLVCNPHNPTGRVSSGEEIDELCEWAKATNAAAQREEDEFHLIFDELYAHSIYDPVHVFHSAIPHALSSPFVHVVRGFAKDFGLCGFKTGYGFSSNERVQRRCRDWQGIMRPATANAVILREMLTKSDFGRDVYAKNAQLLADAMTRVRAELEKHHIPHVVPRAGVFVLVDLSKELSRLPDHSEYSLWRDLYEKTKVNVGPGKMFGCAEPGWYRLCPFAPGETIEVGIARLGSFLKELRQ